MTSKPVKIGIVGLGRWAKVLTRAAQTSDKFEIVAGHSRSEEKRAAYEADFGIATVASPDELPSHPEIAGCNLTVPHAPHCPSATAPLDSATPHSH